MTVPIGFKFTKKKNKECECVICGGRFLSAHSWAKACGKECSLEQQRRNGKRYRSGSSRDRHLKLNIERQARYAYQNKDKVSAQKAVQYAVQSGKMTRPDYCESCLQNCKPQGHHVNYKNKFEVIWLCARCHKKEHL